jgi:hypothetical protein
MESMSALNMYNSHGPLPLATAKTLLANNPRARLTGYCSSPNTWTGPYVYACIDLCDLQATIHAYDPDEELREAYGCSEEL